MKEVIELFTALSDRLLDFGSDAPTREVIARACRANGWFTPHEVKRAVAAIAEQMLRRDRLEEWLTHYPSLGTSASATLEVDVTPITRVQSTGNASATSAAPAASETKAARSVSPHRVLVVMAGNIPFVGFFDLLCVVACGDHCLVKPSSKDRILVEYIVGLLRDIDPTIRISFYDGKESIDAVIATGGESANRHFRSLYAGTPSLLRGSRQSVAVLTGKESAEQLQGLAEDIWAFSGLGCRNVSLIFLPEGCVLNLQPPPLMNEKYRNNYLQTKALMTMLGEPFRDLGCAVATPQCAFPTALSQIAYTHYRTTAEVETWLEEHDEELQCVVSESVTHNRRVGFGRAQHPRLIDYPDARDVVAWLTSLKR